MNRESIFVRHGRVTYAARLTKMNGLLIRECRDARTIDRNELVDGLWMTCARLVNHGGYLCTMFFASALWQLTHAPMSVTGQAVTT